MENLIYWIVLIIGTAYFGFRLIYYMHMFQLNSYREKRLWNFMGMQHRKILSKDAIVFLGIMLLSGAGYTIIHELQTVWVIGIWMIALVLRLIFVYRRQTRVRTKKPLVYTGRVKRILGVAGILYVLTVLLCFRNLSGLLPLSLVFILVPLYMVCANILLKPFDHYMASYYYKDAQKILKAHKDLIIIGITGSYGKTSTKFILEKILSQKYNTLVTPHSYNTTLGVIKTIREKLNRSHEVFVAEMGAKQKNDIKEICDLVHPSLGVLTAIGPQHLETFKNLSNIIDTKFELIEALPKDGIGFVNGDSSNIRQGMSRYPQHIYKTYGQGDGCSLYISNVEQGPQGSSFKVSYQGKNYEFNTRLLGSHNILNITGAIGVGFELGVSYEKIRIAIQELQPIEHRLQLKHQGDYYILDDAFNANPTGAKSALNVLDAFKTGRKIIMTPGMIELGSMDYEVHLEFGKQIAKVCDFVILIGEEKTKAIKEGLEKEGFNDKNIFVAKTVYAGFGIMGELVQKNDVVLIENDLPDNFNE